MISPFKSSFSSIICPAINLHIWCGDFHWFFPWFSHDLPIKNPSIFGGISPASDRRTRTGPKRSSWSRWGRDFQLFRRGVAQGHWDLYNTQTEREIYIYICKRDLSVLFDGLTNLHSKENKVNKDWFSLFTFWGSRKIKKIKIYSLYFLYLLFEAPGK